jgi:NAD(P)-dependent dehydrogenase (short-subunit alcohol dehydrogenase family)
MLAAGRGRIVSIASTAGLRGVARVAAYSASKHGLIGLTRSLSLEVAQTGVTVNAVCPGYTESDMSEQAIDAVMKGTGRDRAAAAARIARSSPLGRLLTPEEVAASVVWLCSDAAAAITGEAVVLGG